MCASVSHAQSGIRNMSHRPGRGRRRTSRQARISPKSKLIRGITMPTQLSDVIVPEFYETYGGIDTMTSTALFQSGGKAGESRGQHTYSQQFLGGRQR